MGVTTTADEKRNEAKEHLSKAYEALLVLLNEETCGHSDFNADFIDRCHEAALEIIKIKRKI